MEAVVLTILSILAFLGVMFITSCFLNSVKPRKTNNNIKLLLYIPRDSMPKLEEVVHLIYKEQLPEKCMVSHKLYLIPESTDQSSQEIIEGLKATYPIVVLPDALSYCIISKEE